MSGGVPAGWVLVPVEPTKAMVDAGRSEALIYADCGGREADAKKAAKWVYRAMLAAAPTPPPSWDADVERVAIREYLIACADECDRQGSLYAQSGNVCAVPKLRVEAKAYRNAARMVDEQAHSSYRSAALQALGERG